MMCTLCRTVPAVSGSTTCTKCGSGLPGRPGAQRLAELSAGAFRSIGGDDEARRQRKAALAVRCPFCKAPPGSDCKKSSHRGTTRTAPHPSRLEAAAGPKAA